VKEPHPALRATFSNGEGTTHQPPFSTPVEKVPEGRMRSLLKS
jgi:hypothetical protein